MNPVRTAARVLLSSVVIAHGARMLANPEPVARRTAEMTDRISPLLERTGLPTDARSLVRINGALHTLGGLLLATGHLPRLAAGVLAATLAPTTVVDHPFWNTDDPAQRTNEQLHFLKNLGLFGGLLLTAVDTQGKPGLRWRIRHTVGTLRRIRRTVRRDARIAIRSAAAARRLPG
jgi:putative oxidoreductase